MKLIRSSWLFAAQLILIFAVDLNQCLAETAINIGSRMELFVDHYLIEKMDGTQLKLHAPQFRETVLDFDKPWEGKYSAYMTILRDGPIYRMYYRGLPELKLKFPEDHIREVTCYAESYDGIHWTKPNLGIYEVFGTRGNNVVLADQPPFSTNFSPLIDIKPGVAEGERFKAIAGLWLEHVPITTGLVAFVSEDGIHWRRMREEPIMTKGAFDSQNIAFWSESENCYVCYYRTWTGGGVKGYRTISRSTSMDFLNWSDPIQMDFGNAPSEHLYENKTFPYFRAPHIYLAFPMRFIPGRKVLTDEEIRERGLLMYDALGKLKANWGGDCAEVAFMTSRGDNKYDRTFLEGFIRPGLDPGNWASRGGMTALGVIQTCPTELSIYKQHHYAQSTAHVARYTLRIDGFVSINAPFAGGELVTKPLQFQGSSLTLNFSTGAAGGIRVEILDVNNQPVPGYTLDDADEIAGDSIERIVTWGKGSDISSLSNKPVRLRFIMKDADLFSIRFK